MVVSKCLPKSWGHPAEGRTFNAEYPTENRTSGIPGAGTGWWARCDIPSGVRLRRCSIADGSLHRFEDEQALRASGWDLNEAINYGISHKNDRGAIFYTNPGTMCNHADKSREASVKYNFDEKGVPADAM